MPPRLRLGSARSSARPRSSEDEEEQLLAGGLAKQSLVAMLINLFSLFLFDGYRAVYSDEGERGLRTAEIDVDADADADALAAPTVASSGGWVLAPLSAWLGGAKRCLAYEAQRRVAESHLSIGRYSVCVCVCSVMSVRLVGQARLAGRAARHIAGRAAARTPLGPSSRGRLARSSGSPRARC